MKRIFYPLAAALGLALLLTGCPKPAENGGTTDTGSTPPTGGEAKTPPVSDLTGSVGIDGSSTVYPITEAVAEEFMKTNPNVNVTVGISGTGGGFKRFSAGETDISDASRPIKQEEADACAAKQIAFVELPIAYDALTIVVNPQNDWCTSITVEELKKLWDQGSTVKKWSDIRAGWPAEEIKLYGPDTDSGTFDYFTEAINGKSKQCRTDYTASADDNVLVTGVAGEKNALAYFGLSYFEANQDKLKAVPVDNGKGPVEAKSENVNNGTYTPLSRPLFIYISKSAIERPEISAFVDYYMANAAKMATEVGYVQLPDTAYTQIGARWTARTEGSVFLGKDTAGMTLDEVLAAEGAATPDNATDGGAAAGH